LSDDAHAAAQMTPDTTFSARRTSAGPRMHVAAGLNACAKMLQGLASALVSLVDLALSRGEAWRSSEHATRASLASNQPASNAHGFGLGVDVPLLEASVRGLAYMAGTDTDGRAAVR
jgi:hypothetical protein